MWTTALTLTLLGAAAGQETASDKAKQEVSADDLRAAFLELEDAYDEARSDYFDAVNAAYEEFQAQEDQSGGFQMPDPIEPDFYPDFQEIADLGSPDATLWCIQNHGASGLEPVEAKKDKTSRYLFLLGEERPDEMLVSIAYTLIGDAQSSGNDGRLGKDTAFRFMDVVDKMTESDDVRVTTLYGRGQALSPWNATPEQRKAGAVYYKKAAELYPKTELGQRCAGMVFAAENLQIGMKAPDIVGKDHDGNDLKLSDFEGKVTVIDFWGFW